MRKTNTTAVHGEASVVPPVLLSVLTTLPHISAQKTAPVTGKKLQLTECL